jgi:ABC-type glycerol-3-phosphate transport system substrate-binding protein
MALPRHMRMVHLRSTICIAVPHNQMIAAPERQLAAWLFIKWLTEPEQSARWTRATDYLPVRRSAAAELTDYFAQNPQFEKAFGFLGHDIAIEPGLVAYDECRDLIGEMLSAVVAGEDPATWLDATLEECNAFMQEVAPD